MNYRRIEQGDRFVDPMDDTVREVAEVRPYNDEVASIFTTDGGVVGSEEISEVYLPGELIPGHDQ